MKNGDKIIDVRDNTKHIVECVDVYDEVTLVFTEDRKYIPLELTRVIPEIITNIKKRFINLIKPVNKKVLTSQEWVEKFG
jgi:hypothetical protein